jgi:hypothetical protein
VKEQFGETERRVLTRHTRAVVHMRQQIALSRFGLCLGAGVSKAFGLPMWGELIASIAADPEVDGTSLIGAGAAPSQSSRTQVLFQRFRSKRLKNIREDQISADDQRKSRHAWTKLVHRCLYKELSKTGEPLSHPFLGEFLPVVRNAPMTVTYNFDDSLERMLSNTRNEREKREGRGYETVWRPSTQLRSTKAVIYHPNGFLPMNLVEGASEDLVFSEDSFADQLIATMGGHYSMLLSHLSRTTCLLLGLSLEDATFKHLLRQNARQNPGNYHYYVAFVDDKKGEPSTEQQAAITSSNFEVYNLITLFLRTNEIAALGRLLTADHRALADLADEEDVPLSFCFYLSGAVGAGKTTTVGLFPSLNMYDEWIDPKHPLLIQPFTDLTASQIKEVDSWVAAQFRKKNWLLLSDPEGIQVVDRCQLDPLAFVSDSDRQRRAGELRASIAPNKSRRKIRAGHVIVLRGDDRLMAARTVERHKGASLEYVQRQQQVFAEIYPIDGVTRLDVRDLTPDEVVRRIARLIHLEKYCECDLHTRLRGFEEGTVHVSAK